MMVLMRRETRILWTPTWFLLLLTATLVRRWVFTCVGQHLTVPWLFEQAVIGLSLPGFSLDSGKSLVKKGQLTVVAGAPRANHSGAVVLLKKGPDLRHILVEEYILEGQGLASSFGYDLTVLDLNGDGWVTHADADSRSLLLWHHICHHYLIFTTVNTSVC